MNLLRQAALALLLVFQAGVFQPAAARTEPARDLTGASDRIEFAVRQIENVHNRLAVLTRNIGSLVAKTRYFSVERKLIDADLLYTVGEYDKAAALYRDVAESAARHEGRVYFRSVCMLGESLVKSDRPLAATRYFKLCADPSAGEYFERCVANLFTIAARKRSIEGLDRYERLVDTGVARSPEVLYAYGKYLTLKESGAKALNVLQRVPADAKTYPQAQYLLGVLAVGRNDLDGASQHFRVATMAAEKAREREMAGLARIAWGRILFAKKKYALAAKVVEDIDPDSSHYPESLYDLAWINIRLGHLNKAVDALDVLLMNSMQGDLALKATALRGRILSRMQDRSAAEEAYTEVLANLGPVSRELDVITGNPERLRAYFEWVMKRSRQTFGTARPVSESTQKWLESDPVMAGFVSLFEDLATERERARNSLQIASRLLWVLRSEGRLVSFPVLKEKMLRLKDMEGTLVSASVMALDAVGAILEPVGQRNLWQQYLAARKARRLAHQVARKQPVSYRQFVRHENRLVEGYRKVQKQLFMVQAALEVTRHQVVALEKWIRDLAVKKPDWLTPSKLERVRASLAAEKARLHRVAQAVSGLSEQVERALLSARAASDVAAGRAGVPSDFWTALDDEASALRVLLPFLSGRTKAMVQRVVRSLRSAIADAHRVRAGVQKVLEVAEAGARQFERIVQREVASARSTIEQLQETERESGEFVKRYGGAILIAVRDRIKKVLLEADVGLVDMAWQRYQELHQELEKAGIAYSKKASRLNALLKQVKEVTRGGGRKEKKK